MKMRTEAGKLIRNLPKNANQALSVFFYLGETAETKAASLRLVPTAGPAAIVEPSLHSKHVSRTRVKAAQRDEEKEMKEFLACQREDYVA